ncbi:uncharacterized protein B0H64DRAFT_318137 [Chaetomium fimeti]|uniref:Lytic polysaccharide monooxygenase n=1 Tax=Chaetomium fimeti TaxID=1854472 RepID=A0AAE0HNF0_9PEZI|nr:hypothetical protein B0H64DRAFT_318137 [Chaetomium fimeti]
MFSLKSFVLAGGLIALADAHMKLRVPTPYSSPPITSSPIDAGGANYPCQTDGNDYVGEPTKMEKGSKQELGFTGSAVHGGGSCQVSITYDEKPNAQSSFKVLKSIQGGCPARGVAGNIEPEAPEGDAPDTYEFMIPEDIPSGKATIAWTWFNKIGNREFYMNCAPVEISGSGGSEAGLAALPDMLIANIAQAGTCKTAEGSDIEFPNPGSDVETAEGDVKLAPPDGECAAAGGSGGSGGSSGGSATAAPGGAATPAVRGRHFRV